MRHLRYESYRYLHITFVMDTYSHPPTSAYYNLTNFEHQLSVTWPTLYQVSLSPSVIYL
jgi:hypothetical protein